MVPMVSPKPSDVCRVSAVPTACGGATSVTRALNCAESATTVKPHTSAMAMSSASGAPANHPMVSAHRPLTAMAAAATRSRPRRSA